MLGDRKGSGGRRNRYIYILHCHLPTFIKPLKFILGEDHTSKEIHSQCKILLSVFKPHKSTAKLTTGIKYPTSHHDLKQAITEQSGQKMAINCQDHTMLKLFMPLSKLSMVSANHFPTTTVRPNANTELIKGQK